MKVNVISKLRQKKFMSKVGHMRKTLEHLSTFSHINSSSIYANIK